MNASNSLLIIYVSRRNLKQFHENGWIATSAFLGKAQKELNANIIFCAEEQNIPQISLFQSTFNITALINPIKHNHNRIKSLQQFDENQFFRSFKYKIAVFGEVLPPIASLKTELTMLERADNRFVIFRGDPAIFDKAPLHYYSLDGDLIASVDKHAIEMSKLVASLYTKTDKNRKIELNNAISLITACLDFKRDARLLNFITDIKSQQFLDRSLLERHFAPGDRLIKINGYSATGKEIEKRQSADLGIYLFKQLPAKTDQRIDQPKCDAPIVADFSMLHSTELYLHEVPIEPGEVPDQSPPTEQVLTNFDLTQEIDSFEEDNPDPDAFQFTPGGESKVRTWLLSSYGADKKLIHEKYEDIQFATELFFYYFSPGDFVISRTALPLILLGKNTEYIGGMVAATALSRELFVVVRKTKAGMLRFRHSQPSIYPEQDIELQPIFEKYHTFEDWQTLATSLAPDQFTRVTESQFIQFILISIIRTSFSLESEKNLPGFDVLVVDNIEFAEASIRNAVLVVALIQAVYQSYQQDLSNGKLISITQDVFNYLQIQVSQSMITAAVCCPVNKILPIQFSPLSVAKPVLFPDACRLVFCPTGLARTTQLPPDHLDSISRKTRAVVKRVSGYFNKKERMMLIREFLPKKLQMKDAQLYQTLKKVPEQCTMAELHLLETEDFDETATDHSRTLSRIIHLRGIFLYLISEYARVRQFIKDILQNNIESAGRLLRIAHDGERVASRKNGRLERYKTYYTDELLDDLTTIVEHDATAMALFHQSGTMQSSSPEVDELVDALHSVHGILGAHISGIGAQMGAIALAEKSVIDQVVEKVEKEYYEKRGIEAQLFISKPVAGRSVVSILEKVHIERKSK